jgi:hypothetical protein
MTESEDSAWRMNALVQVQVRVRQSNRLTLSSLGSTIPLAPELRELTSPDQLMQDGLQGRSVTSPAREARCGMIIH